MIDWKKYYAICFFMVLAVACKQSYEPAAITTPHDYLVMEGFINNNRDSVTSITLSRTRNLTDTTFDTKPELNARLVIEGEGGDKHTLQERGNGKYTITNLLLNSTTNYRLRIQAGNNEYLSAYVPVKNTPAIDSLSWQQANDVTIYVNTHDPQNKTRFYRWDYVETWEHHASLETSLGHANGLIFYTDSTNQTFKCWTTAVSSSIVLGSTVQLSQDVVNRQPVAFIPKNDERISVRYSLLVKQYALTEQAFDYWQILQRNTQELGTLFDAQPSQLKGNIICLNDPSQPVIGYVSAGTVSSKRIFINRNELTNWEPPVGIDCRTISIPQDPNNYLIYNYPDPTYSPYYFTSMPGMILLAKNECLNCLLQGGENKRPSFW